MLISALIMSIPPADFAPIFLKCILNKKVSAKLFINTNTSTLHFDVK